ncbi:MAG: tetratricopeptide repeat protein [Flammeovirgaceae bacterium]|nr:tetratricopeptide repeat protein [Flammeovirgaceae bacterium]
MKAISQKQLKHQPQLLQPAEEKPVLNSFLRHLIKKAGACVCLFCFTVNSQAQPINDWATSETLATAYKLALNVQPDEAKALLKYTSGPQAYYVTSLANAIELLITEDESKFDAYEDSYEQKLDALDKVKTAESLFVKAELRLQWAFVYLKFGHEFDAAWNVRQAYITAQECRKSFPKFVPIKKTIGLLDIMIGSVPEKYTWILDLLSMKGSVERGLKELEEIQLQSPSLTTEATLLSCLAQGFLLQQTQQALDELERNSTILSENRLALFLSAVLAAKNSDGEKSLAYLNQLESKTSGTPIYYLHYLKGESLLHKGDYDQAIDAYRTFVKLYPGENYLKDAFYKMGICYWLKGDAGQSLTFLTKARNSGNESTEADKHAARSLTENTISNPILLKIRYATDGGYYEIAKDLIQETSTGEFLILKDQVEFNYRKARFFHKTNQLSEAKQLYLESIKLSAENPWYFAPNACLQLGYIYEAEKKNSEAKIYFKKALSYKRHEYKNSIDSKAKSALEKLK